MTRAAVGPDIFLGWARCAVAEGMTEVPIYVKQAACAQCADVETTWFRLLQLEEQRKKLVEGKVDPETVTGYTTDWAGAETDLHRRALQFAMILSWGDR